MLRTIAVVVTVGLAAAGCDSKKQKCEKLAEHMETISAKEHAGISGSVSADYQFCMDDLSDREIECMMKARSTSDLIDCSTPR